MPDRRPFSLLRLAAMAALLLIGLGLWGAASAQDPSVGELQVERATPTSLSVVWDEVTGATNYAIRWRLVGTPRFGTEVAASGGEHQVTGLLPGRQYVVQVRARDADGTLVTRLTGTFRTVLTTPVEFAVTGAGAGSLTVSWGKPEGWDPSAYELRWRRPSDAPFLGSVKLAGNATGHTLDELDDQTQYVVNLIALNDVGDSSLSVSDTGWAVDPLTLTLSAANEECVAKLRTDLSWEIAGGLRPYGLWVQGAKIDLETAESHRVSCGSIPTDPETGEAVADPTKTFAARVLDGLGTEATAEATVNLVRLSGPTLSVGVVSSSSAALTWTAPDGWAPVAYRLRWRLQGSSQVLGQVDLNAATRSYTLSQLDANLEYVLRLTALHASGLESLPHTARVSTYPPLTLTLSSSRQLCTANTLTELSWEIAGGKPPYTLTIDGETVNPDLDTHRLSCGPIPTDPVTGDPADSPSKTFSATVMDAQSVSATSSAEIGVDLASALLAPDNVRYVSFPDRVSVNWNGVKGAGSDSTLEPHPRGGIRLISHLLRYRSSPVDSWLYTVADRRSAPPFLVEDVPEGELTLAVAAVRHELEIETPDALRWSEEVAFARALPPPNLSVTATHDTINVVFDKQPLAHGQIPEVSLRTVTEEGQTWGAQRFAYEDGEEGRHQIAFTHLPPDTEFHVYVIMAGDHRGVTEREHTIKTAPAPPGYQPRPSGARNVRATATTDTISVSWDAPHPEAKPEWTLFVGEIGQRHILRQEIFDDQRAWTIGPSVRKLKSGTEYLIRIVHNTFPRTETTHTVWTLDGGMAGQERGASANRSAEQLLRFFPVWPVPIDQHYSITGDPFEWRTQGEDRWHAGLDIGDPVREHDEESVVRHLIEGDPVYAVADGRLRLFNYELDREYVLYCPLTSLPFLQRFIVSEYSSGFTDDGVSIRSWTKPGDSMCRALVTPHSGRTVLVFHNLPDGNHVVTKYAHLKARSIPSEVLNSLFEDPNCTDIWSISFGDCVVDPNKSVQVQRSQIIGRVGRSLNHSEEGFEDVHLHFEIRWFDDVQAVGGYPNWYDHGSARNCGPVTRMILDCRWTPDKRRMVPTIEDVEAYLPPLPASWVPRDPSGGRLPNVKESGEVSDIRDANVGRHVIEIESVRAPTDSQLQSLSVAVSTALWRPIFYAQYRNQESRSGYHSKDDSTIPVHGIQGTAPGVDQYHTHASCAAPANLPTADVRAGSPIYGGDPSLSGELPRELRTIGVQLGAQGSCAITVRASNRHWEAESPGQILDRADQRIALPDPLAHLTWVAELAPGSDSNRFGQELEGNAINLYTFTAHPGLSYSFCTMPETLKSLEPLSCSDETSSANVAELLLVGSEGVISDDVVPSASGLQWQAPASMLTSQTYALVVRRRDRESQSNPTLGSYAYSLRYTVPQPICRVPLYDGPQGASEHVCPAAPKNPRATEVKATTAKLSWDSVGKDATYQYRAVPNPVREDPSEDCGRDLTENSTPVTTTNTSHSFSALIPATKYVLCVRVIGSTGPEHDRGTITSDWAVATTTTAKLPKPTMLAVSDEKHDRLTLGWRSVVGADGYDVRATTANTCDGEVDDSVSTSPHTFEEDLEASTTYRLCVRATRAAKPEATSDWESESGTTLAQTALTVTIDASAIAGDGIVNIEEKAAGFDIEGTATAGASVSVTVGETTLTAVKADKDGDWSVTVPEDSSDVEESSVDVTAEASKEDHENATTDATFQVDLTAPTVSYERPSSLQVDTVLEEINPTTNDTDIDSYTKTGGDELPPGLTLDESTGVVSGTPSARGDGVTTTVITGEDDAGNSSTATLSLPRIEGLVQVLEDFEYTPTTIKWGGDAPMLTPPTGAVGALSYSASPASVCTVNETSGVLAPKGLGDCTITATAAATITHEPATAMATVTIAAPTLTGVLRAVKRSEGQVEFGFRPTGGDDILPSPKRFVRPSEMTPGTWANSSTFTATVDEREFTVGKISVRLNCAGYIEVTLLPAEGERLWPTMRNFFYKTAAVDAWRRSGPLTVTLSAAAAASAVGAAAEQMEAAAAGAAYPSGTEGGLLAEAAGVAGTAVSTAPCAPENLRVTNITAHSMTLNWDPAPGAASYEVMRTEATTPVPSSGTTSHEFDGLSAATEYTLSVRAKRGEQTSDWAPATETTLALSEATVSIDASAIAGDGTVNIEEKAAGFSISGTATAGASVSVTVGGTTLTAVVADDQGAWSVNVPANSSYITEGSVSVSAEASKEGHENATATATFQVDLTAPMVSYPTPSSLKVDATVTVTPTTSDTDIASYALATGEELPDGLTLDPLTGVVSGEPYERGDDVTTTDITVRDRAGNSSTARLSLPRIEGLAQTLSGFEYTPAEVELGDDPPILTAPTGAVGTLTYIAAADPANACTVDEHSGALTIHAAGSCTVTATAAATITHEAGSDHFTVTIGDKLATPVLSLSAIHTNSVTMGWGTIEGAEGYRWRWCDRSNCQYQTGSTTGLSQKIGGLSAGTEYEFGVRAISTSKTDSDWASVSATTLSPSAVTIDASAIAGDGTVNIAEQAAGFSIGGTATAGASVSVTVGGTTLTGVIADDQGAWSVNVPANSSYITEGSVSVSAKASKEGHESATATAAFQVDLTAPVVTYPTPSSLQVDAAVTITPVTTHTDIASYALATGQTLPAGLSLNGSTGVVSGEPEERGDGSETEITVRDRAGNRSTARLSLPRVEGLEQTPEGFAYAPAGITLGHDAPTLTPPTGAVGALSYSVTEDSESICSVVMDSGVLTIKAVGTCTVIVTAAATKTHERATAEATVTIGAPTLTGVLRAVNRSNGQIEFSFRPTGGDDILPSPKRFVRPSEMTPGTWTNSSTFTATVDEREFTVGKISVRLSCAGYIEVTLLPAEGARLSPDKRNFYYKREPVDAWHRSEPLTVTLTLSTTAGALGNAAEQMEAAEAGFAYPDGVEGGLLAEAAAVAGAAVSTAPCTPENLEVTDIGQHSMTLNWDSAPGAASYEVRRTQATTPVPSSGTTSHEFDGLNASTEYTLSVRAKRGAQMSDWADATETTLALTQAAVSIDAGAIAGDGTVNIAERVAGFSIGGTATIGASVSVTVGGTTLTAVLADEQGDWSVEVPANSSYITEGSVSISAVASKSGHTNATATATLTVDLTAPTPSYAAPSSLQVGTSVTINPTTADTDIASYALATGQALPGGLRLAASNGAISGAPTARGGATRTVIVVRDRAGNSGRVVLSLPAVTGKTQTLSGFAYTPAVIELGGAAPALTAPKGAVGTLTYSVTNDSKSICSVDENTGAFTAEAESTCTVTATAAATSTHEAATIETTVTIRPPLAVSAQLSATTCKRYESVTLSWTITGGIGPYEFKVDGTRQGSAIREASFECTARTATQSIEFEVVLKGTDTVVVRQSHSVTVTVPDYTFEGRIRARVLDSGKVEVCFQLRGSSDCILPARRIVTPSTMVDNRWYNSSMVLADYNGDEGRTLGQISARKASANANIELQFAAGGEDDRIAPSPRFFNWRTATPNQWQSTGWITHTLEGDFAERQREEIFEWMDPPTGDEATAPGSDGGPMAEEDSGDHNDGG